MSSGAAQKPKPRPETQTGPSGPSGTSRVPPGQGSASGPSDDDLKRLATMLTRIRRTLDGLVEAGHNFLPEVLASQFELNWPQAKEQLSERIDYLEEGHNEVERQRLLAALTQVGLTGPMLTMKETSLTYYLDRLDGQLFTETPTAQITGGAQPAPSWHEKVFDKVLIWVKPAGKVINSIIGSLLNAIPGGLEVFKEFKEHYEAACDIAEAIKAGRAEE